MPSGYENNIRSPQEEQHTHARRSKQMQHKNHYRITYKESAVSAQAIIAAKRSKRTA